MQSTVTKILKQSTAYINLWFSI